MHEDIFQSQLHESHNRWAILEDDGKCAWLYISKPNSTEPASSCFAYNRIPPIPDSEARDYAARGDAPPLSESYASSMAVIEDPKLHEIVLAWSKDGSSAEVVVDGRLWVSLRVGEERGHSRAISREGPYGIPLPG